MFHRENVLCPNDLTLERHRLFWLYLNKHTNFFTAEQLSVMHVAPEQCFLKPFRNQKNLNYTTSDLESPIADMHFDLHEIPLDDNQYDVIFCNHVLEHVENSQQCIKELCRIMKPGGWGILQVPIDYSREDTYEDVNITSEKDREREFWQKDHLRLFGKNYPEKLKEAGFEVEVVDMKNEIDQETFERYRLDPKELLYIVSKPVNN